MVSVGRMRNMIDKVLRNPFRSFCLLTGLAGRKCNRTRSAFHLSMRQNGIGTDDKLDQTCRVINAAAVLVEDVTIAGI